MKVAVSSTGKELRSPVDPRFGRADFLLIIETDTCSIVEVIDNTEAKNAAHGAGINAASRIAEAGVKAVLTGRVGPKAAAVCEKAHITMVNDVSGTVENAVRSFTASSSTSPSQPSQNFQATAPGPGSGRGQGLGTGRGDGCRATGGGGRGLGGRGRCRR